MTTTKRITRRRFLAALGVTGGAAAIAAGSRIGGKAGAAANEARESGYRLTEHVRRYYETTKV